MALNMYRYIEDGLIIGGPQALPTNWRNKGDISAWTPEQLAAEGWLPNVVQDERRPGEIDAGWIDELFDTHVLQRLQSQPAPVPDIEQIVASIEPRVQQRLDDFAATRRYQGVNSISKYQNISDDEIAALPAEDQDLVRQFRIECRYIAVKTAQTWAKCYQVLAQAQEGNWPTAGAAQLPTSYEAIEGELPALEWPQ
jgi:hypothetical protein